MAAEDPAMLLLPGKSVEASSSFLGSANNASDDKDLLEVDFAGLYDWPVRNLDTGEERSLLEEDPCSPFFDKPVDPTQLLGGEGSPRRAPWQTWWQENANARWWQTRKQNHDILSKAVQEGDAELLERHLRCMAQRTLRHQHIVDCGGEKATSLGATLTSLLRLPCQSASSSEDGDRLLLHVAACRGHADCARLLMAHGAAVEARADGGLTALHLACRRGRGGAALALLECRGDLLARTEEGDLPLHLAVAGGHGEIISLLLRRSRHASFTMLGARNRCGQRPTDMCPDLDTVQLLEASRTFGEQDSYAARTPLWASGVVLRNARADVVRLLLHRTQMVERSLEQDSPPTTRRTASSSSCSRRRARFCKPRERHGLEVPCVESFELVGLLGCGQFGKVHQVRDKKSDQIFAMKVQQKDKALQRYMMAERNVLSYMRHPCIVRLYYAFQTPSCIFLVLQYCPGGDLSDLLKRCGALPEPLVRLYAAEIWLALEYLHERQVVYRDLKPENVVLDEGSHALLTDFGMSKQGVERFQGTSSFCGSMAYLAPEVAANYWRRIHEDYGTAADLYGLGVLIFELLHGYPAFQGNSRELLLRKIARSAFRPLLCSREAAQLIQALMQRDPARRLGANCAAQLRDHCFFAGVDFEQVLSREVAVPAVPQRAPAPSAMARRRGRRDRSDDSRRLALGPSKHASWIAGWDYATPTAISAAEEEEEEREEDLRRSVCQRQLGWTRLHACVGGQRF